MSFLKKAVERTRSQKSPLVVTVAGEAGQGKSTLAAAFPKPFFVMVEDGLRSLEEKPDGSLAPSVDFFWQIMDALLEEDHDYETVVIDSVTKLEDMFIQSVIEGDKNKPKSINHALGGYGAGMATVGAMHLRVRRHCEAIKTKRGCNIVFIAHANVENIDLPDSDPFMRYSVRLSKQSIAPYRDDVDVVGFVRQQMFLKDGKAVSTDTREFVCMTEARSIGKNRLGVTAPIPFAKGENPLAPYMEESK